MENTVKKDVNEEVMNELKGIKWSSDEETTVAGEAKGLEENKEVTETVVESKTPESDAVENKETEIKDENKETEPKDENKEAEQNAENKETEPKDEQATGKKRDVLKFGNKDWAAEIPEDQKFNEKTVFCWKPGEDNKIGYFAKYGKKEGMIWINMYKKDSFTLMSREWAARLSDCEVIEQDGKMLSDKYIKDEKGYHVKKDEKKEEVAAAETAVGTAVETTTKVPEANEVNETKVEMPLAE
jgi:hypothetical protein